MKKIVSLFALLEFVLPFSLVQAEDPAAVLVDEQTAAQQDSRNISIARKTAKRVKKSKKARKKNKRQSHY